VVSAITFSGLKKLENFNFQSFRKVNQGIRIGPLITPLNITEKSDGDIRSFGQFRPATIRGNYGTI
jgi:hypothetical protein